MVRDEGEPSRERPITLIGDSHRALTELVCDALRAQIVGGERRSGQRLVETEVARDFGVSRNPVREAIKLLAAAGFVHVYQRRGAVVAELSREDAEHLFDVREALEAAAAGAAARKYQERPPNALVQLLEEQEAVYHAGRPDDGSDANADFHHAVVVASGNPYLLELLEPLRWKLAWIYQQSAPARAPHSFTEHRMLAVAIDRGNEADARQLTSYHIRQAKEAYLAAAQETNLEMAQ